MQLFYLQFALINFKSRISLNEDYKFLGKGGGSTTPKISIKQI